MRELRPYLTRDAFGGSRRIICRLRSLINAGRSDGRFIFRVKNLQQIIDIISNTDIIRVSNKKFNLEVMKMEITTFNGREAAKYVHIRKIMRAPLCEYNNKWLVETSFLYRNENGFFTGIFLGKEILFVADNRKACREYCEKNNLFVDFMDSGRKKW